MKPAGHLPDNASTPVSVVVIGAGQAGLSAGYHLLRKGYVSAQEHPEAEKTFVILDANPGPGGAWQHRWESLRMNTVNGIFDLPGFPKPPIDPDVASKDAVPEYFAAFEKRMDLPILRPAVVTSVWKADADPSGPLLVEASGQTWRAGAVINATGTWTNPTWPEYPGAQHFQGRQLHVQDYVALEDFAGQRVAIVGGGISALELLEEISRVAEVFWYTRREPVFRDRFSAEEGGRETVAKVSADVEAGIPTGSVVSYTGLIWAPYALAAKERGVLVRRPMFTSIEARGVRNADGTFTEVDTILWATGFKPELKHLEELDLRNDLGGIKMRGTQVASEPRLHLIGYGPSQSTVGANRAGREAVRQIDDYLWSQGAGSERPSF